MDDRMTNATLPAEDEMRRLEQAADWLQQLRSRESDDGLVERWLAWCAADPRNQRAFDGMVSIWEATAEVPASPSRRTIPLALAAGIAGLLFGLAGLFGWAQWQERHDLPVQALTSPVGTNSRAELSDGSVLELGGRSEATVSYTRRQRRVELLGGQMFVTVSQDSARPFVVDAGGLQVTAVGTAFDVLYEPGRAVVTVMEGQTDVRVAADGAAGSGPGEPIRLVAGQQLAYVRGSTSLPVRRVDPLLVSGWRNGVLNFVDVPLGQVVASLNRYVPHEILIEDAFVGDLAFTGTARLDRIEYWLAALPTVFPVTVVELPDGKRLLRAQRRETRSQAPAP